MAQTPEPPETIEVVTRDVACDGGGGGLGHPKVYLTLEGGRVECPYCDRMFILQQSAKPAAGH